MEKFFFDLQRFADSINLAAGETHSVDGITYTALDGGAVLTVDDENKVSGISSGSVVAELAQNPAAQITFDGTTAFDFQCTSWENALGTKAIRVEGGTGEKINYTGGQVTYSSEGISSCGGTVSVTGVISNLLPFDVKFEIPEEGMSMVVSGKTTTVDAPELVNATLSFPEEVSTLVENIKPLIGVLLDVDQATADKIYDIAYKLVTSKPTAQIVGTSSWNQEDKRLTLNEESQLAFNILGYEFSMTASEGNVDGLQFYYEKISDTDLTAGAKFTPSTDEDAALAISFGKDGSTIYDGTINITSGTLEADIVNAKTSVADDTTITLTTAGGNKLEARFEDAASLTYSADDEGVANFTFGDGDGKLTATLYNGEKAILTAGVELNGAITVDTQNQTMGVTGGTEAKLTIGQYEATVNITADTGITIIPKDDIFYITADESQNAFDLKVVHGEYTVFDGSFKIVGSMEFDATKHTLSVSQGGTVTLTRGTDAVTFTATGEAGLVFSVEGENITLEPNHNDGSLDVLIKRGTTTLFDGNLEVSGGQITLNPSTQAIGLTGGTTVALTQGTQLITMTATGDAAVTITPAGNDTFTIEPGQNDGSLDITMKIGTATVFDGNLEINGAITLDNATGKITIAANTTMTVTQGEQVISITASDEAAVTITPTADGKITLEPGQNDGALDISITQGTTKIFQNTVDISGKITFDPATQSFGLTSGTTISVTLSNYEIIAEAKQDAASVLKLTADGITLEPASADGTIDLTLKSTTGGEMSANIEVLSGSFTLGHNGALTVAADTELQIKFSDDYIINFKANDEAGGKISLGADGITFEPTENDGGLQLSITRDGQTRSASLDVTGSVTYKLDGSISLTAGTVVKNVFDDGNILTIKANTDAGGTMRFSPDSGLTIEPSTTDALTATLTTGDLEVAKFTSIDGSITYSNGIVTATNGTNANLRVYDTWDTQLSTSGGTASLQFTDDRTVYTANKGATFTLEYVDDGMTLEIQNGSFSDIYENDEHEAIELISVGSTFKANDEEFVFTLEKAGNYTLNGINVTTTSDGVQVQLLDYNTITTTDGISYKALNDDASITFGADGSVTSTNGVEAQNATLPAALADFMLHKTEAGYPAMAALAFHPDEENPPEPENYHSAEKWTTTSSDKLELSAVHYSPENPTGKWVILVHGYGKSGASMNIAAKPYLAQGVDVLIIDQRAAGESEGDWLTMGVAEANDLALWTQEITKTNSNAQIILHGVSMGAATVMLAAASSDTENLSAIIEDCGYGNVADVFAALMTAYGSALGVSGGDYYELFDDVAAVAKTLDGGYDVGKAAPINSIAEVTVPSLFIHGADDSAIPSTNADALYSASGAENKTKLIIDGAGHAKSFEVNSKAYLAAVKKLIATSTSEIGAEIESEDDDKLLRGTIYDDTIISGGQNVTIEALAGTDSISNSGDNVSISGGADDDSIYNSADNVSISGGADDDSIYNEGFKVTIDGGKGNDSIVNDVDSTLTAASLGNSINAGAGDDTIYNYHSYHPTLIGGKGDDSIVVSKGHYTFADGGEGNDTILGIKIDTGWAIGGHASVLGGTGDDYISTGYTNDSSIDGGKGNDTIVTCGLNNTIDPGAGENLIDMDVLDREDQSEGSYVVFNGKTTVNGFTTGFGEGTDTVYYTISKTTAPNCDFTDDGLTFYNDHATLTFEDLNETAKLNFYYEPEDRAVKGVFITDDAWYKAQSADFSGDAELYFVGASALPNHGVNFSAISDPLNISLDTDYEADVSFWVNNVYSVKGGAGLTTITGSAQNDTIIAGDGAITINAAAGDDKITLNSSAALVEYAAGDGRDTIHGFNENSTLSISGGEYYSSKHGKDLVVTVGESSILLEGAARLQDVNILGTKLSSDDFAQTFAPNHYSVVSAQESDPVDITLTGGDVAIIEDTAAQVSISASDGNDTIVSQGENVTVKFNGGATKIFPLDGKMTLENYDHTTRSGLVTSQSDILAEIEDGNIGFKNGTLKFGSAYVDTGERSGLMNFYNGKGAQQKVGFASKNASLDASTETDDLILQGGDYSQLRGSSGNDTIFAGKENFVDPGDGENYVKLQGGGSTIVLNGKTTVEGFTTGLDYGADTLYAASPPGVDFTDNGLTFFNGSDSLVFADIFTNSKFNMFYEEVDGLKNQLREAVFLADDQWYNVAEDGEVSYYVGATEKMNHGVDFSGVSEALDVTLETDYLSTTATMWLNNVHSIIGGAGETKILGSAQNDTIQAGTGETSITGGGGKDLLIGNDGDKRGSTEFIISGTNKGAQTTISGFEFIENGGDNQATFDNLNLGMSGGNEVIDLKTDGDDLAILVRGSSGAVEKITLKDAAGKEFLVDRGQETETVAQIAASEVSINNSYVDFYAATEKNATVKIGDVQSAKVWLESPENSDGVEFVGDFSVIDARGSEAQVEMAGNDAANTIYGGLGYASMWGGAGSANDLMVGGTAHNEFYYEVGNGNDTILGSLDGDIIHLGATLEQIDFDGTTMDEGGIVVKFNDGGKLNIDGNSEVSFSFDDGTTVKANRETRQFE